MAVFECCSLSNGLPCYVMTLARGETLDVYLEKLRGEEDHWRRVSLLDRLTMFLKLLERVRHRGRGRASVVRPPRARGLVPSVRGRFAVQHMGHERRLNGPDPDLHSSVL